MIYGWLHYIQSIAPQSRIANLHSYARCISVMFLAKLHVGCVAIPLQFLPSPSKPSLHLHSKLPILLIQTAFSEQSFLSVAHSSISTGKCKQVSLNCTYRECRDCIYLYILFHCLHSPSYIHTGSYQVYSYNQHFYYNCRGSEHIHQYLYNKER